MKRLLILALIAALLVPAAASGEDRLVDQWLAGGNGGEDQRLCHHYPISGR